MIVIEVMLLIACLIGLIMVSMQIAENYPGCLSMRLALVLMGSAMVLLISSMINFDRCLTPILTIVVGISCAFVPERIVMNKKR